MKKIVFFIIVSAVIFSTMEVALKIAASGLDPFQLTFIRFVIGGLFLLPFALIRIKKNHTVISGKDYLYMLLLGIVCIPLSMVLFQMGVERSNASTAAVIFCINPVFTVVFAHFLTDEKFTINKVAALIVGILGILFMATPWDMAPGNSLLGAGLTTLSALLFGLYSALGRKTVHRLGGLPQTSIGFLLGSFAMFFIMIVLDKPILSGVDSHNILLVLYVGIIVTGLGYLTYFMAMEHSDAGTASIVFFIKPGLAPIFAYIILGETLTISGIIGIALVFISSYINLRGQRNGNKIARNMK